MGSALERTRRLPHEHGSMLRAGLERVKLKSYMGSRSVIGSVGKRPKPVRVQNMQRGDCVSLSVKCL